MSEKSLNSVNIWQNTYIHTHLYSAKIVRTNLRRKQERDCLVHFVRLANTLLKDGESARNNHVFCL